MATIREVLEATLPPDDAARVYDELRRQLGGTSLYIEAQDLEIRDRQIVAQYQRNRQIGMRHVEACRALSQTHCVTVRHIQRILRKSR